MKRSIRLLGVLGLAAILGGCFGDDDNSTPAATTPPPTSTTPPPTTSTSVTVTPSLGKIKGGKVRLVTPGGTQLGSTATTDANGTATITFTDTLSGPVIVEVAGDTGATYFDEARKAEVSFAATDKMRAAVPTISNNANIGVTKLTEVAYNMALANAGSSNTITAAHIQNANKMVQDAFKVTDILAAPTIVGVATDLNTLASNASGQYAAILAGLAQLAQNNGANAASRPALDIMLQLSNDLKDGKLDGLQGTAAINGLFYVPANFAAAYAAALKQAIAQNPGLTSLYANYTVDLSGISVTIGGGGTGNFCVADVSVTISVPVTLTTKYKVCYKNPPAGLCAAGNAALNQSLTQVLTGISGSISAVFAESSTCPSDAVATVNFPG